MKKNIFAILLFATFSLLNSCKKVGPVNNAAIIYTPPPPPPAPPPSTPSSLLYTSCPNYSGVCMGTGFFPVVNYAWNGFSVGFGGNGAAVTTGNKIFFAGGHGDVIMDGDLSIVAIYNDDLEDLQKWEELTLSIPRSHLSAASAGNKVLFAGGKTGQCTYCGINLQYFDMVEIYDANTYSKTTGRLSEARSNMASATLNNKAYFIGGKTFQGFSRNMDVYDANSDTWTVLQMPTARAYSGAAVIDNKIYICGGKNDRGPLKTIDVYDVITGTWSVLQAPNEHPHATVIVLNNKIFMAGGNTLGNNNIGNGSLDIYNTVNNSWRVMQLSDNRFDIAAAVAKNKIIFLGGNYSSKIDVYNDSSETLSIAELNRGTSGAVGVSFKNKCFFAGLLFDNGSGTQPWLIIIEP